MNIFYCKYCKKYYLLYTLVKEGFEGNLWFPSYGRKIFPVQVSADFFPDHILF